MNRKKMLFYMLCFSCTILWGCSTSGGGSKPTGTPTPSPTPRPTLSPTPSPTPLPEPVNISFEQTVALEECEITVHSYEILDEVEQGMFVYSPDDGNVFVFVDVTIKNIGYDKHIFMPSVSYSTSKILETYIIYDDNKTENFLSYNLHTDIAGDDLNPLESVRGNLMFEIDASIQSSDEIPQMEITYGNQIAYLDMDMDNLFEGTPAKPTPVPQETLDAAKIETAQGEINEAFELDYWEVLVHSVELNDTVKDLGVSFDKLSEGCSFIVVDTEITNTNKSKKTFNDSSNGMITTIVFQDVYECSPIKKSPKDRNELYNFEIEPSESADGVIIFMISDEIIASDEPLVLRFSFNGSILDIPIREYISK